MSHNTNFYKHKKGACIMVINFGLTTFIIFKPERLAKESLWSIPCESLKSADGKHGL